MIVRLVGNAFETNVKGTKMSEQSSDKPCSTVTGAGNRREARGYGVGVMG